MMSKVSTNKSQDTARKNPEQIFSTINVCINANHNKVTTNHYMSRVYTHNKIFHPTNRKEGKIVFNYWGKTHNMTDTYHRCLI